MAFEGTTQMQAATVDKSIGLGVSGRFIKGGFRVGGEGYQRTDADA